MSGTAAERFAQHSDWITRFRVGEESFGGNYSAEGDSRFTLFAEEIARRGILPKDLLECGCLEGGHTVQLARQWPAATVHAVDVRPENLAKTRLVCELFGLGNVVLSQDDLDAPQTVFARGYDAIFCVGLLYHLRWPDRFLQAACRAAPLLWLWTVYCAEEAVAVKESQYRGRLYDEPSAHPLSAVRDESFFPTLGSLAEMLWAAGYTDVSLVRKEMTANGNGPAILLCASR